MTDLLLLAERVEGAEGPDRQLDAMIHWQVKDGCGVGYAQDSPHFTASLDAALTLVPEGCVITWDGIDKIATVFRAPEPFSHGYREIGEGKNTDPALALTAACLRARHSMEGLS